MTATYPDGYGDRLVTLDEMTDRHPGAEPEYWRRWQEMCVASDGLVGVGGGWRETPSDTSDASRAGHSFHQTQTFADGTKWWMAVDLVGRDGRHAEARTFAVVHCAEFGLVTFTAVNNEPWHVQADDVPHGWSDWVNRGRPRPTPRTAPLPPPTPIKEMVTMYTFRVNRQGWPTPVDLTVAADGVRWNASGVTSNLDRLGGAATVDPGSKEQLLELLRDRPGIGHHPFGSGDWRDDDLAAAW